MQDTAWSRAYEKYKDYFDGMQAIKRQLADKTIPEEYPIGVSEWIPFRKENNIDRNDFINISSFALVSNRWVKPLAEYVKQTKCLEIMAGRGVLAKALNQQGTDIVATDDFTWVWNNNTTEQEGKTLTENDLWFDVENIGCIDAIKKYGNEVGYLICSWPNMNESMYEALVEMRIVNTSCKLIYIGEGIGGFNASDSFFKTARLIKNDEHFNDVARLYQSWTGIDDSLYLVE